MNTVTINGLTVSLDQIARFAPIVKFHPKEQYFPCAIDYLLEQAQLVNQAQIDAHGAPTVVATDPTQEMLAQYSKKEYRILIDPSRFAGQRPDAQGNINVPMYVSVQVPPDRAFVDLTFIFLFAYQGAQIARTIEVGKWITDGKVNFQLPHYGEHQGDLETVTVRVTPDFAKATLVRFEAHGDPTYYTADEVDWEETHPLVCCALNAHGTYNGRGKMVDNDWFQVESHANMVAFIDMIGQRSFQWRPFLSQNLVIVGLDDRGNLINSAQPWTKFQGQIGARQNNAFDGVMDVDNPLSSAQRDALNALVWGADFISAIPTNKKIGDGTAGLGNRLYIVATEPFMNETGYIRSKLGENLVLSVNPADPSETLIIDAWQIGQPAQLWERIPCGGDSYVLVNTLSGQVANYTNDNSIVNQVPFSPLSEHAKWTWGGDKGGGFAAIRPLVDSGQNLNVPRSNQTPGTQIYTWTWSDGQANETWRFDLVTDHLYYYIRSKLSDSLVLSVDPNNPTGPLMIDTWVPNEAAQLWQRIPTTNGYALVNMLSGLAACFSQSEGIVIQTLFPAALNGNSAWTSGGDKGNGFAAIRPVVNDGQNLNIPGSNTQPGTKICTWKWGDGQANEIWCFNLATSDLQN